MSLFEIPSFKRPVGLLQRSLRSYWGLLGLAVGAIALLTVLNQPASATDIRLSTTTPQLGETVAVIVPVAEGAAPPTVTLNSTAYPAFPYGANRYRALVPTTPLDAPGRKVIQVATGGVTEQLPITLRNRAFPTQRIRVRGGGSGLTEIERSRVRTFLQLVTPEKFWQGAFVRPATGEVRTGYGVRRYYNGVFAQDYYHKGVDYANGVGAPAAAPAAGRIALVGRASQGFEVHGNTIGIDHGQGVLTIFLHLSRIDVQEGDLVWAGQVVGAVGATGAVTGPNLHWGLYVSGKAIDPTAWREGAFS